MEWAIPFYVRTPLPIEGYLIRPSRRKVIDTPSDEEWTEDRRERVGEVGTKSGRFKFCS